MSRKIEYINFKYSNLISLFATAEAFLQNGENVYNSKFQNHSINVLSVIVVNYSFSIELYLKWLYAYKFWQENESKKDDSEKENRTQCIKTHCLNVLFDNLPKDYKDILLKELNKEAIDENCLNSFLETNNKAFEDWRYVFENEGIETDITPFKKLSKVLESMCEKEMQNYHPNSKWVEEMKPIGLIIPFEDVT